MARTVRKSKMKEVSLSEIKDDLSRFLREAETREIVITRHGKPAGVLIGFESEEDWFEYRLENDPRFLRRVEQARRSLDAGRGVRLEDLESVVKSGRRAKPTMDADRLQRSPVNSSTTMAGVGYDATTQTLEIEFRNGHVYQYHGVEAETFEQLMNARSKGQFLNAHVRNSYPFSRVS
jgi:prevent-host-death family protein